VIWDGPKGPQKGGVLGGPKWPKRGGGGGGGGTPGGGSPGCHPENTVLRGLGGVGGTPRGASKHYINWGERCTRATRISEKLHIPPGAPDPQNATFWTPRDPPQKRGFSGFGPSHPPLPETVVGIPRVGCKKVGFWT
jgi:hypothetical protein